jgi:glycolate oxidase iron-sulfur subunit
MEAARAMARRNVEAFERASVDVVVVNSAGCGAALKEYPEWLRGDGGWEARARALAGRVRDVTELLVARGAPPMDAETDGGAAEAGGNPVPAPARLPGRVAYDAPCHLLHAQGIRTPPLAALGAIQGLEVEPLPSMDRCCGGAGVYNLRRPELSARVLAPKLAEIREGGYDWVATGNPGCLMFIGAGLLRAGDPTPAVHPVEIVDRAESG